MLTAKEKNVLNFIQRYYFRLNMMPTLFDIKNALSMSSEQQVIKVVKSLNEKGALPKQPNTTDSEYSDTILSVIEEEEKSQDDNMVRMGVTKNCLKNHIQKTSTANDTANDRDSVNIPHLGQIAAGTPIESFQNIDKEWMTVSQSMIDSGEHYALTVVGDSMIDAGINDGDVVIIQRCREAENGDIIVALIDGQEVTLKKMRKINHSIALEPANANFETRIYGPSRISVQGRLVSLMRKFH